MKHRSYHIGPGAASLILIIVVLSMSVLAVLSLASARSDDRLGARGVAVTQTLYALSEQSERHYAELDALLMKAAALSHDEESYTEAWTLLLNDNYSAEDDLIRWTETAEDERKLLCAARVAPFGSENRLSWAEHRFSSEFLEMDLEDTWN